MWATEEDRSYHWQTTATFLQHEEEAEEVIAVDAAPTTADVNVDAEEAGPELHWHKQDSYAQDDSI
jgi:hypothetical protein